MLENGETKNDAIRLDFNKSIFIDFAGAKITSDAGFLMLREVDQRFDIIQSGSKLLKDTRSISHKTHSFEQMIRQRVYQIAAGYENCDNADLLRIDPALRLALDKGHQSGAGQSNGLSCDW
ncbi:MAG: transposase [Desulfobacterales bacterium]